MPGWIDRHGGWSAAARCCAFAASVALVAWRLFGMGDAPFIQDEPYFLSAARDQLLTHEWASASPIFGTQGLRYGPSVLWLYGGIQALFGPAPETAMRFMVVLVSASQVALAIALARGLGRSWGTAAVLLTFIASSPYQHFWSRLAWDQLADVTAAFAAALIAWRSEWPWYRAGALGLVLGVGLSSHPMVLPLAACAALQVLLDLRKTPRRMAVSAVIAAVPAVAWNVPYLMFLWTNHAAAQPSPGFSWQSTVHHALMMAKVSTVEGISYFFDGEWPDFVRRLGGRSTFDALSGGTLALIIAAALAGYAMGGLKGDARARRMTGFGLLVALAYALFYGSRSLDLQPHYHFPSWWVVPVGIALLLAWAVQRQGPWRAVPVAAVVAVSALQLGFIGVWRHYIDEQGGTRGLHYSATVRQQREAIRLACEAASPNLLLENATNVLPYSLSYLVVVEPGCAGKRVLVCPVQRCPAPPGVPRRVLTYERDRGGALALR